MGRWSDEWWPPPSRPRPAKGGIRARSRRGAFAESWWGKRWIEVLEGFPIGSRLRRGRSYARSGQVLEVAIDPGRITARVQGSRARPYQVTVELEPLSEAERGAAAEALARRPRVQAALLAGEMPREVEGVFGEAAVPLFPQEGRDLGTSCSCPDWSNPCKHIAAVYYLVAEELDRNPFLLLRLRGLARGDVAAAGGTKEEDAVAAAGGTKEEDAVPAAGRTAAAAEGTRAPSEPQPLPADPDRYWGGVGAADGAKAAEDGGDPAARAQVDGAGLQEEGEPAAGAEEAMEPMDAEPATDAPAEAAHLRALGRVPFWRGEADPDTVLTEMVRRAQALGTEVLAGEEPEVGEGPEDERRS